MFIAAYVRQHNELLHLATELIEKAEAAADGGDHLDVVLALGSLASKLRMHLAMEDDDMYPTLIASENAAVAETAKQFMDEMGGLAAAFEAYHAAWPSKTIAADPAGFVEASRGIVAALAERIDRENNILYPMASATPSAA